MWIGNIRKNMIVILIKEITIKQVVCKYCKRWDRRLWSEGGKKI